ISLVLCAATVVWWVRSYHVIDNIGRVGEVKVAVVHSVAGGLIFSVTPADLDNEEPGPRPYYVWHTAKTNRHAGGAIVEGKRVYFWVIARRSGYVFFVVPHWVIAFLLSVLPSLC